MNKNILVIGIIALIVIVGVVYFVSLGMMMDEEMENPGSENMIDESMETGMEESENMDEMNVPYMDVSAAEAKKLIDENPGLIVIDVSPHYDNGHLPRAVSYYPLSELRTAIPRLNPDAMYLVYCHADGPSRAGAEALSDAGFTNVYRLESHFGGWQDAGYDIEL